MLGRDPALNYRFAMKGTIKTYLPEKKYGFIRGDDGKDYFFHENDFVSKGDIKNLCEDAFVDFDQIATPRGYKARHCAFVATSEISGYITPDSFITSKSDSVRGWEILERGDWIVFGTSENSPDAARRDLLDSAARIGANALINLAYFKSTGSEPGTGKGTHFYTIHNFSARPVILGKRSSRGSDTAEELCVMNARAKSMHEVFVKKTLASKRKRDVVWTTVAILSLVALNTMPLAIIPLLLVGITFGRFHEYGWWLQRG